MIYFQILCLQDMTHIRNIWTLGIIVQTRCNGQGFAMTFLYNCSIVIYFALLLVIMPVCNSHLFIKINLDRWTGIVLLRILSLF